MGSAQLNIFEQDLIGLNPEEASVFNVIKTHEGRDRAIKAEVVGFHARMSEVKVRQIIARLVNEHGKPIGSVTGNPPGFYMMVDDDEIKEHAASLRKRGMKILKRAGKVSKMTVKEVFEEGLKDDEEQS